MASNEPQQAVSKTFWKGGRDQEEKRVKAPMYRVLMLEMGRKGRSSLFDHVPQNAGKWKIGLQIDTKDKEALEN